MIFSGRWRLVLITITLSCRSFSSNNWSSYRIFTFFILIYYYFDQDSGVFSICRRCPHLEFLPVLQAEIVWLIPASINWTMLANQLFCISFLFSCGIINYPQFVNIVYSFLNFLKTSIPLVKTILSQETMK